MPYSQPHATATLQNTDTPDFLTALRQAITHHSFVDEETAATQLLHSTHIAEHTRQRIRQQAAQLIEVMRDRHTLGVESFMQQFPLSEKEGVLIMCLAEALLRIPDTETMDKLIRDKFTDAQWNKHLGDTDHFLVNASSWGLMLTGKILQYEQDDAPGLMRNLLNRAGEPVIRQALQYAMRWMGSQFILGQTIEEGIANAAKQQKRGYTHSYDMLGEGARNDQFAQGYLQKYQHAIAAIGKAAKGDNLFRRPSISIKLSALHPRYESRQKERVMAELLPRLKQLLLDAKKHNIMAAIDAEEARRLDVSLDLFEMLYRDADFADWEGISIVVQAYQKRAIHVVRWLSELAADVGKRIPVRLVKGAYWDSEIKEAQIKGAQDYPVFTRKVTTDLSYIACAQEMLRHAKDRFYPQFATHNANTVATIMQLAPEGVAYEFQRLHGMGENLHDQLVDRKQNPVPVRIYAPIGVHKDLLAYLVRRLLENGANSSFIHQLADKRIPIDALTSDPLNEVLHFNGQFQNPEIPLPAHIYSVGRPNSQGLDMNYPQHLQRFAEEARPYQYHAYAVTSLIHGHKALGEAHAVRNPANGNDAVGQWMQASEEDCAKALAITCGYQSTWATTRVSQRADILRRCAELLERERFRLMALLVREAGKTLQDAVDEVREAVDFCHYYALHAEKLMAHPQRMDGPTGEHNSLSLHPRGTFFCVSPWNFPLAIFTGQIMAALVCGNTVIAKPAEQTSLIAHEAVRLFYEAGIPEQALSLLLGDGAAIGKSVLQDTRIAGVAFTGSLATARAIQQALFNRGGALPHLIAETGGQNCMIVDSSALHEQVVDDVLFSAFGSAGQRCSALRILCVQEDVADEVETMLQGAMREMTLGNPWHAATDIGPIIDAEAKANLQKHQQAMRDKGRVVFELPLPDALMSAGHFVAPSVYRIDSIAELPEEHFGPILHILRFKAMELDGLIEQINASGYGLTLGVHSRIDATIHHISSRAHVGNIYINRGMTGAVVGVQPFGGENLSGTGFKAGGPYYLLKFLSERTLTVNTAAIGGNLDLFTS